MAEDAPGLEDAADFVGGNLLDGNSLGHAGVDPGADLIDFTVGEFDFARRHLAGDDLVDEEALGRFAGDDHCAGFSALEDGFGAVEGEFAEADFFAMASEALGSEDRLYFVKSCGG